MTIDKQSEKKKGRGRPGGNPEIAEYGFKQKEGWRGPCTERLALKMPADMKQAIKNGELKDWQEICRRAIATHLGWENVPDAPITSTNQD